MDQTQNRISDERLEWVASHPRALDVLPSEASDIAVELTALRASHKRLVEALEAVKRHLEIVSPKMAPMGGAWHIVNAALADARKLEGK